MIRLRFAEPVSKMWKRWVSDCQNATTSLLGAYKPGQPFEILELYRRKSIKESVYFAKAGPFKGRCAYCECYVSDFQHGDLDHFRPKKGVTDEADNPVSVRDAAGQQVPHPGYYWRAYNWRNLLPCCITCNQPGDEGIGKRNRFPVEQGKHAESEEEIPTEKPLLINPIDPNDDDPEAHLDIELETGMMKAKNQSRRGKACIDVFGLNKRDQLVKERKSAIEEVKAKYAKIILIAAENNDEVAKLRTEITAMEGGAFSYTLARRAVSTYLKHLFQ